MRPYRSTQGIIQREVDYVSIWSREIEGEDFPVHEVVFEASEWQQCYQKLVDNAKADIHTVGWYWIIGKESKL